MPLRRTVCVLFAHVLFVGAFLLALAPIAAAESHAESTSEAPVPAYRAEIESFFATLEEGEPAKALDALYGEDNPRRETHPDELSTMQRQFESVEEALGTMHGYRVMAEETVAERYVLVWYVVYFDAAPVSFYFKFYKPADEWRFGTFEFKNDLGQIALERARAAVE